MDWLERLAAAPADLAAKHLIAQSTKDFFGYGPRGRAAVAVQGDLAVFATELTGPGILQALPEQPFGRLALYYVADLYRRRVAADLGAFATARYGVGLQTVLCDIDLGGPVGYTLGVALLSRSLPPPARPAPPDHAARLRAALAEAAGGQVQPGAVVTGPALVALRGTPFPLPGGDSAAATGAALQAWDDLHVALRPRLSAALSDLGYRHGPIFLVQDEAQLIAGALLER